MIGLTAKQKELKRIIRHFIRLHKIAPTRQELTEILGLASRSAVGKMLTTMAERGHLIIASKVERGLMLIEE